MAFMDFLKKMVEMDGSDLYVSAGAPISCKIHGQLSAMGSQVLSSAATKKIAYDLMNEDQIAEFEKKPEMNMAISEPGVGRFRVNIFKQRSHISMVIRSITTDIPQAKDLGVPEVLLDLIMEKRGLILFVGGTGSGKSTSLAALIDHRNRNSKGHIITIEDPVEFVHHHQGCIINQREVGVDTDSYEDALENTLRQAPDVILIGEIRSQETMEHALAFAETGHLCVSTLHANNANQALDRIINFFPEERHNQLLQDLSLNMRGIISQRLVKTVDGKRAAAIEILLGTPRTQDLIAQGEVSAIKEIMDKSEAQGMQTFDGALLKLYQAGKITLDEAMKNADSKNNLRLKATLGEDEEGDDSEGGDSKKKSSLEGLSLESIEEPGEEEAENEEEAKAEETEELSAGLKNLTNN